MSVLRLLLSVCWLLPLSCAWAQFELPGTDIWLLHVDDHQIVRTTPAIQRAGYDNQPAFSHDGKWLYYTQGEVAADGLGYTDIWRLNLASGSSQQVTSTPVSEFSPLPMPLAPGISTVRVQTDGSQELWSVFIDSERPELRIVSAQPVGYHTWLDADRLALFVLGDPQQGQSNRLELWQPSTDSSRQLADDIGRGLQSGADGSLYYVQNPSRIMRWHTGGQAAPIITLYENGQDFGLGPDGSFWHGTGSKIYRYARGDEHWQLMIDLQQYKLTGITRVAVSPDGSRIAVVVSE